MDDHALMAVLPCASVARTRYWYVAARGHLLVDVLQIGLRPEVGIRLRRVDRRRAFVLTEQLIRQRCAVAVGVGRPSDSDFTCPEGQRCDLPLAATQLRTVRRGDRLLSEADEAFLRDVVDAQELAPHHGVVVGGLDVPAGLLLAGVGADLPVREPLQERTGGLADERAITEGVGLEGVAEELLREGEGVVERPLRRRSAGIRRCCRSSDRATPRRRRRAAADTP